MTDHYKKIKKSILDLRNKRDLKDVFWKAYQKSRKRYRDLKILILNAPCHGFGDIVFAMKLSGYLREWYKCKITIASTQPGGFTQLGEDKKNIVELVNGRKQCRRFKDLDMKNIPKQDLIFVAPVAADFEIDMYDIKQLISYANIYNTFFFSEYNDSQLKRFDFPTGVGGKNMGILLTKPPKGPKNKKLKREYALVYIAETIPRSIQCFLSFVEMVIHKYKYDQFEIVIPPWILDILDKYEKQIVNIANKNYSIVRYINRDGDLFEYVNKTPFNNNILLLRGDILPVNNKEMLGLIKHSVKDILLTGDQSITDTLSCCMDKNIFYQIAPWKESFGKQLSIELPNKFLSRKKTSCGTKLALKYDSDYSDFLKKWDFRKNAKPKIDAIVASTVAVKEDKKLEELQKTILNSRTLDSLKNKLE